MTFIKIYVVKLTMHIRQHLRICIAFSNYRYRSILYTDTGLNVVLYFIIGNDGHAHMEVWTIKV